MEREQTTLRLTVRLPEILDKFIRKESTEKGISINHVLLKIIAQGLR